MMRCLVWFFLALAIAAAPIQANGAHAPEWERLQRHWIKPGQLFKFLCQATVDAIDTDGDKKPDVFVIVFEKECAKKLYETPAQPGTKKGSW